ncbi:MAG: hypothetical protein P8Y70_09900 [Candidatus Lokiarchaeota archaeon]
MGKIRICPRCKQPTLKQAVNVSGWLAPDFFECTKCNYRGPLYLEIDPKDYKLENADAEDNENDSDSKEE